MNDCSKGEEKRKRGKGGEKRERFVLSIGSSILLAFSLALISDHTVNIIGISFFVYSY